MSAGTMKQILVELTRGGCRVESLAHATAVVTFRSPLGVRYALAGGQDSYELRSDSSIDRAPSAIFGSLHEAIRAACLS
jgi:hypothetical protein